MYVAKKKKMDMKIIDLQVSWMKIFVFKINPLTLKLGHLWIYDSEEIIEKRTINWITMNGKWFKYYL